MGEAEGVVLGHRDGHGFVKRDDGEPDVYISQQEMRSVLHRDRVKVRLVRFDRKGRPEGRILEIVERRKAPIIGRLLNEGGAWLVAPEDRRYGQDILIPKNATAAAVAGQVVAVELTEPPSMYSQPVGRITEVLGEIDDPGMEIEIAVRKYEVPYRFSAETLAQTAKLPDHVRASDMKGRINLTDVPLVTIDGEDARDFDDAVYAEPDGDGFSLIVAIADVAHYVRPGSPLDRSAWTRGNSCYFPDRVVPMLPEALSNGWCSLRPNEDRGCLFVRMRVDADGKKLSHAFGRGIMRSAARLTYEQVQEAHDAGTETPLPIAPLYAAFRVLLAARIARGTLDLDLPERKVVLDDAGRVASVQPRPRLDSHRLIEEFMVLANVCAAEELERLHRPCMYRIHAPPSDEKLDNLRGFLRGFDISLPPGNQIHPRDLDRVLKKVAGTEEAPLINEVMLRSQSQAAYSPDNIGHFGLSLARYAHFTSPIRRYADLMVHRSLIAGLKLGAGGLTEEEAAGFPDTAEHISATERRAALAERDAIDRYLAAFMADKVGAIFQARISGVTRFGLFVTVAGNGASGLVPVSSLPDDFWMHDEATASLNGRRTRLSFRLAQEVEVRLAEARPVTGGLLFQIMQGVPARADRRPTPPPKSKPGGHKRKW